MDLPRVPEDQPGYVAPPRLPRRRPQRRRPRQHRRRQHRPLAQIQRAAARHKVAPRQLPVLVGAVAGDAAVRRRYSR